MALYKYTQFSELIRHANSKPVLPQLELLKKDFDMYKLLYDQLLVRFNDLESLYNQTLTELNSYKDRYDKLKTENNELKRTIEQLKEALDEYKSIVSKLQNELMSYRNNERIYTWLLLIMIVLSYLQTDAVRRLKSNALSLRLAIRRSEDEVGKVKLSDNVVNLKNIFSGKPDINGLTTVDAKDSNDNNQYLSALDRVNENLKEV